jgi:UDP-4-amino-4,6-dideoxy-N-acetyl-beta-L-altrosamine transaminase
VIPYGRQEVTQADMDVVAAVLAGDWLTTGPYVTAFEEQVAEYVGARYAVAFSSATAALHGATYAAGLGAGDTVFTSPLTFIASANCARYVGAQPALIDIDPATLNIDVSRVDEAVHAFIPVHYAGLPVELDKLPTRPRVVIEDASHALGAHTPDGPVGNCARSDMCVFSFHPVKPLTTGEGGMVTTNDPSLAEGLRAFRSHGINRTPTDEPWYYDAAELGYNYRLTDIQAALGSSQLTRLDSFIERRNAIAERYREALSELPVILPPEAPVGYRHGYHLFAIQVENRAEVFAGLRDLGIGAQVHYVPVHHHGVSRDIQIPAEGYPAADKAYAGLISLPIYPSLTVEDQGAVINALKASL